MGEIFDSFKKFIWPLWVFAAGMGTFLFSLVLYPAIGTAQTKLQSDTAAISHDFWGLDWAMNSTRLFLFVISIALILISALWAFRTAKSR